MCKYDMGFNKQLYVEEICKYEMVFQQRKKVNQ